MVVWRAYDKKSDPAPDEVRDPTFFGSVGALIT